MPGIAARLWSSWENTLGLKLHVSKRINDVFANRWIVEARSPGWEISNGCRKIARS